MHEPALLEAARTARDNAYAPYSGYAVGAALIDEQGRTQVGCNVENISFGVTICAERSAIARMVADGGREIRKIAVVTKDGGTPCGMCLQALAEFTADPHKLTVYVASEAGQTRTYTLAELLPHGFASGEVSKAKHI